MKILIISTVGLSFDGITSVVCEYIRAMDRDGLNFYVADTIHTEETIRKDLLSWGCKLVPLPDRRSSLFAYYRKLRSFIRKEKIDIVHAHGNSATLAVEMLAAKLGGCKRRIAHSHNTQCEHVKADRMLRPLFKHLYTDAVACGKEAGKWLFGDKPFLVLNNGRDLQKFRFRDEARKLVREEFSIGESLAVGNVAGFVPAKNHEFLLKIYAALLEKDPDIRLFMIGDGDLRPRIEEKAKELGIFDRILFTGKTTRVPEILQGLDVMVLPSLYEGLPLVVMEWQAAGLPSVLSDTVTKECRVTDLVTYVSLDENPEKWADMILSEAARNMRMEQSSEARQKLKEAGYDIKENAAVLKALYLKSN
jgi:glycosyltransferase involved in cell wall biosynthesis